MTKSSRPTGKATIEKLEVTDVSSAKAYGQALVNSAISSVPFFGSAAIILKSTPHKIWVEKQTVEMLEAINWLIDNIQDIKERLTEPEFLINFQNIVNAHWLETNESRRTYLRNILKNNCKKKTDNLPKLITIAKQVNENEILILDLFDGALADYVKNITKSKSASTREFDVTTIQRCVQKMSISFSEEHIFEYAHNLTNLGLLKNPIVFLGSSNDKFLLTNLGCEFISYVKEL